MQVRHQIKPGSKDRRLDVRDLSGQRAVELLVAGSRALVEPEKVKAPQHNDRPDDDRRDRTQPFKTIQRF